MLKLVRLEHVNIAEPQSTNKEGATSVKAGALVEQG